MTDNNHEHTKFVIATATIIENRVRKELRKANPHEQILKELALIKEGEEWLSIFNESKVTIVSYSGTTHKDSVTFIAEDSKNKYTFDIPAFLGFFKHPSLRAKNEEEPENTQNAKTETTEEDDMVGESHEFEITTFGFKKARKFLREGIAVTRLSLSFFIYYDGTDFIAFNEGGDRLTHTLTADDIFADDWCLEKAKK